MKYQVIKYQVRTETIAENGTGDGFDIKTYLSFDDAMNEYESINVVRNWVVENNTSCYPIRYSFAKSLDVVVFNCEDGDEELADVQDTIKYEQYGREEYDAEQEECGD